MEDTTISQIMCGVMYWETGRRIAKTILMAGLRVVCIAVVTWGFLESVLTSFSISRIWIWTAFRQNTFIMKRNSFLLVNPQHRQVILNAYGLLRLCLEPMYFALKDSCRFWLGGYLLGSSLKPEFFLVPSSVLGNDGWYQLSSNYELI